jgi:hypothetical protein
MAIPGERFKLDDNEFDLPVADFLNILDSGILNFFNNLSDYFPDFLNLVQGFSGGGSGGGSGGVAYDPKIDGDATEVIPLYEIPLTENQVNEIDTIIVEILKSLKWLPVSTGKSIYKTYSSDKYRQFLVPTNYEEGDELEYATTHDFFKTTADIVKKYKEWFPNAVHVDRLINTGGYDGGYGGGGGSGSGGHTNFTGDMDKIAKRTEDRNRVDEYGKTFYDYRFERLDRTNNGDSVADVSNWWNDVSEGKGWDYGVSY